MLGSHNPTSAASIHEVRSSSIPRTICASYCPLGAVDAVWPGADAGAELQMLERFVAPAFATRG
jgi:hypothetical protein